MHEGLLKYSLDRISSLEHYYETEAKSVKNVSKKGKHQHMLGAMLDDYFRSYLHASEQERETEQFKKFQNHVYQHIEVLDVSEDDYPKKIAYRFLTEEDALKAGNIKEERRLYYQFEDMPLIHGSSTLMMLVTRFEEFVSNFLTELYIQFPQKYLDNQQLSFSEISTGNIEEIRKRLVIREVDYKMRESFKEWFNIFSSHGLSCNLFKDELSILTEIYARRNIIVHNSGKVNSTYLLAVPDSKAKLGEKLSADEKYMEAAFETIYRIITLMLIEASKLDRKSEDQYLLNIFNDLFDFLLRGKYRVCEPAYSELSKKDCLSTEIKLMSLFNMWICIIAEKGLSIVEDDIRDFDVTALSDMFKLAKVILLNEYDMANFILIKLLKSEEIPPAIIEEWPLFMWYRLSDHFGKLKEELPDKFGLEREEISDQDYDDSEKTISSEIDT